MIIYFDSAGSGTTTESAKRPTENTASSKPTLTSWGKLLKKTKLAHREEPSVVESGEARLAKELGLYLGLPPIDNEDCPLRWWKLNGETFPLLAKLAKYYLCIQATSCASERAFSLAGTIVSCKRTCLKP